MSLRSIAATRPDMRVVIVAVAVSLRVCDEFDISG
jgi:hypothetical protein